MVSEVLNNKLPETVIKAFDKMGVREGPGNPEEAVSHAVNSKNIQITRRGFSPKQLMFRKQGVVPGITDGNPATMKHATEILNFSKNRLQTHERPTVVNFSLKQSLQI